MVLQGYVYMFMLTHLFSLLYRHVHRFLVQLYNQESRMHLRLSFFLDLIALWNRHPCLTIVFNNNFSSFFWSLNQWPMPTWLGESNQSRTKEELFKKTPSKFASTSSALNHWLKLLVSKLILSKTTLNRIRIITRFYRQQSNID